MRESIKINLEELGIIVMNCKELILDWDNGESFVNMDLI